MQISCVKSGTKYSDDYVLRLRNGVLRNVTEPVEFVCYTDRPVSGIACRSLPDNLPGWWAKLHLFSLGDPMLYFDLDTVIIADIRPLMDWEGFGIIKDWTLPGYNSSIMRLTGAERSVWDKFTPNVMNLLRGDQDWLNVVLPGQATFPPEWVPSFKSSDCVEAPPKEAIAVSFHGFPKPHQCGGWVKSAWAA